MRTSIVYSSRTGNTKKVAEAIHNGLKDSLLRSYEDGIEIECDIYIVGGWIDRATFDSDMLKFVKTLHNKKIAYFFTLGAEPDSKHAQDCKENIEKIILKNENEILGGYCCQGAIDPKLIDWMMKLPKEHHMAPTEARKERWKAAASHPDEKDLISACEVIKEIVKKYS